MTVELPVKEKSGLTGIYSEQEEPSQTLIDSIPPKIILMLASPYIAGQNYADALKIARRIYKEDRFASTIDILGEDSQSDEACEASVRDYLELLDRVAANQIATEKAVEKMTVSFKPSMFCSEAPEPGAVKGDCLDDGYDRIKRVVSHARDKNINVTLEAEDHRWTDFQLETYFSLINEGFSNLGTVLQTRLFRTRNDVKKFEDGMRVRLVIGIYNEPADIAHTSKNAMKDVLVEAAGELLSRNVYVEIATHDQQCLESFFKNAVLPQAAPPSLFETQFLLGVPRRKLQEALKSGTYFAGWEADNREHVESLIESGVLVRLYLPYGDKAVAGPYCKRRLKENPDMIGYGIKNLLRIS